MIEHPFCFCHSPATPDEGAMASAIVAADDPPGTARARHDRPTATTTSAPDARSRRRRPARRYRRLARGAGPPEPAGTSAIRTRCRRDRRRQPDRHPIPDPDPLAGRRPSDPTPDRQRRRHGPGDPGTDRAATHQRTARGARGLSLADGRAVASRPGSSPSTVASSSSMANASTTASTSRRSAATTSDRRMTASCSMPAGRMSHTSATTPRPTTSTRSSRRRS